MKKERLQYQDFFLFIGKEKHGLIPSKRDEQTERRERVNYKQAEEEGRKYLVSYVEENLTPSKYGAYECPFCGSGTGPNGTGAFRIMPDQEHFKCFSCGETGSIYDLVMKTEGLADLPAAVREVARRYGILIDEDDTWKFGRDQKMKNNHFEWDDEITSNGTPPWEKKKNQPMSESKQVQPSPNPQQTTKKEPTPKEEVDYSPFIEDAGKHIRETDYLLKRGISYETAERLGVGFAPNWKHPSPKAQKNPQVPFTPRIIIPTGKGGYSARLAREAKDYEKNFEKAKAGKQGIFNEKVIKAGIGPIFVVEGEMDALSIEEIGFPAVALGTTKSLEFAAKAKEIHPDAFIIALDNDAPGQKASAEIIQELKSVGVFAYQANIAGNHKDPNEALVNDREGFIQAVKKAHSHLKDEWIKNHSAGGFLKEFVNGVSASVNVRAIPTGFKLLDDLLDGGLREGLYGVGAISSLGKTTFVCQIADQIAQQGQDVLIFSLEMSRFELMSKTISRHTALIESSRPNGNIHQAKTSVGITEGYRYPTYSPYELQLIQEAVKVYGEYADHIFISEGIGNIGVDEVRKTTESHIKATGKAPVVIIDYLQILAPSDPRSTEKQNTDRAVLELKRMSRDFKTPVIAISSFNRENYNAPVSMIAFKESGAIEYSTDVLLGIQLEGAGAKGFDVDAAKSETPRRVQVKILKNRRGKTGGSVFFKYYQAFNLFEESRSQEKGA